MIDNTRCITSIPIPMIFVSAIFARLSRQMTRATLTAKMALTAKMRDCQPRPQGLPRGGARAEEDPGKIR